MMKWIGRVKSNRVRLREQGNGSGSLQSEWKESSCGAPVEQIEPGKTNKKMQHMSLMLIMSFNIVMAWWVFTHPVFPSSPQDFPPFFPANIFIVHMFQSSKVKIWQNEWYLQQTFQSPNTLWTLCHSVFIGRFEWLCQTLAWLLCYYFFLS